MDRISQSGPKTTLVASIIIMACQVILLGQHNAANKVVINDQCATVALSESSKIGKYVRSVFKNRGFYDYDIASILLNEPRAIMIDVNSDNIQEYFVPYW
jgi:hypothetical protein